MIANNRGRKAKHLWTDVGEGDPIKIREWTTSTRRRASWWRRSSGSWTRACRAREVAVFYRTNAQSRVLEDMLMRAQIGYQVVGGTKFYERAEVKDARRVPDLPGQPGRRRRVHADRQLAEARDRADVALARARAREHDGHLAVGGGAAPDAVPTLGKAAIKSLERFMSTMERLQERVEAGAPVRGARGDAARVGLPRRAGGRADDRGAGPDREPRGVRARRARVRRARAGQDAGVEPVPAADRAARPGRRPSATTRASSR